MRRWSISALALLASASVADLGWTCGFEDPNSATMQRVMLSVVYPEALYVLGAADTALREGTLRAEHFTKPGDFFALQRTTRNLRRFAEGLADGGGSDLPAFSLVLMGPVLWTRFYPDADGIVTETHVAGPLEGGVVMVTDAPALKALVSGDISGSYADLSGLIRFYGDGAEVDRIRAALVRAYPAGLDQASRIPDTTTIPKVQ